MFDFENLIVYEKAKQFNVDVLELLNRISLEFTREISSGDEIVKQLMFLINRVLLAPTS